MPVPYLAGALRGWTTATTVRLITKTVVNHKIVQTQTDTVLNINRQPVPSANVDEKPEEQRTWKWWAIIVQEGPLLKTDDQIIIGGLRFLIKKASDWSESGFQKYECIEGGQA